MGAPGAGKGTQANLLAERFSFYHIETSKLLEEAFKCPQGESLIEIKGKKYYFEKERELWESGKLCSTPFALFLIKEKVKRIYKQEEGIVFTGSPRTLEEVEELMPFLKGLFELENVKVLFLELGLEQSIWRNSHRRICGLMRHPILYTEETKNLKHCPLDGSRLIKRELDEPEIIKKRFKVFEEQTLPVIRWLKENNYQVINIDGAPPVSDVFNNILRLL